LPLSAPVAPVALSKHFRGVRPQTALQLETRSRSIFAMVASLTTAAVATRYRKHQNPRHVANTTRRATKKVKKQAATDDKVRTSEQKLDSIKGLRVFGDSTFGDAVEKFPSGALGLDVALGGGWAKGRIIEVFGPESSGKTTLALMALASVQRAGEIAVFIDAENALDPDWVSRNGVDLKKLRYLDDFDSGESALDKVVEILQLGEPGLIVVDSVSQLTPRDELEKGFGEHTIGLQARMMSKALRKIPALARKARCTVLFINQIRMKIGAYGNPETRSGGNALRYNASQIVDVRAKDNVMGSGAEVVGKQLQVTVKKNKVGPPFRKTLLEISFENGLNRIASMVHAAMDLGLITRKGAWYYYGERRLGQGIEKAGDSLQSDANLAKEIEGLVRGACLPTAPEDQIAIEAMAAGTATEGRAEEKEEEEEEVEMEM